MDDRQRVVVTGLGVASPLGCSVEPFWDRLRSGESGGVALTDMDLSECRTRIGVRVTGYDPSLHLSIRDLRRLSLTSQMALVASAEAIRSADLRVNECDPLRLGIVLGGATGGFVEVEPILLTY